MRVATTCLIRMWISKAKLYFEIVNLQKVLRAAFKAAKPFEARVKSYYNQLASGEEVYINTGTLCRISTKYDQRERAFTETRRLTIRISHMATKRKHAMIGYSDEDGAFEDLAEIHMRWKG